MKEGATTPAGSGGSATSTVANGSVRSPRPVSRSSPSAEQAGKRLRLGLEALGVALGLGERLTCDVEGLAPPLWWSLIGCDSGDELTLTKDGRAVLDALLSKK
jgi:hypothetical protein